MEQAEALQKQITDIWAREKELLAQERKQLEAEKEEWNKTKKKLEDSQPNSKIKLDIGGKVFATSLSTLTNGKSGYFAGNTKKTV
jgi:chaperonin cofactor prefoldin